MPHFDTATNIVNSAGKELGLWTTTVSNPFASTDANCLQLCSLLNRVGKMLVRARPWSQLTRQYVFDTEGAVEAYDLPTSFDRMLNQTAWNRDTTQPLGGPASPQAWQMMKARTSTGTIVVPFRIFGAQLYLYPVPTAVESIYYEYISFYWAGVAPPDQPSGAVATAAADVIWFDEPLMVAGVKLSFARLHNRDTVSLQAEYDEAWSAAAGGDSAAPILSMSLGDAAPLLGAGNVPDTGFGG